MLTNKLSGVNPKINNMLPAYREARYPLVMVSDSSIKMKEDTLTDMVASMTENVGLVHQMPCEWLFLHSCCSALIISLCYRYLRWSRAVFVSWKSIFWHFSCADVPQQVNRFIWKSSHLSVDNHFDQRSVWDQLRNGYVRFDEEGVAGQQGRLRGLWLLPCRRLLLRPGRPGVTDDQHWISNVEMTMIVSTHCENFER